MSTLFLNNQVVVYLLSEGILLLLLAVAFVVTVGIVRRWDFGSFSERQFALERRAYLVMTILQFVFVVKFFLIAYFVFTIDDLAVLVPGTMCGAGVISANDYGMALLFVKLLLLFFLILWMALNRYDLKSGIFIDRFPNDDARSIAVKRLNHLCAFVSPFLFSFSFSLFLSFSFSAQIRFE